MNYNPYSDMTLNEVKIESEPDINYLVPEDKSSSNRMIDESNILESQ
jgi:hypothetical protein